LELLLEAVDDEANASWLAGLKDGEEDEKALINPPSLAGGLQDA
jgi:hypothetical protein